MTKDDFPHSVCSKLGFYRTGKTYKKIMLQTWMHFLGHLDRQFKLSKTLKDFVVEIFSRTDDSSEKKSKMAVV